MEHCLEPGSVRPNFPFHMVWIATNTCDARCLHCSSDATRAPLKNELSTREVFALFEDFRACGVVDLAISGGEPLLRRDIFEIMQHAEKLGFFFGIGTNGGNVRPETLKRLSDIKLSRLQVSLDGFASSHDRLRQWPGLFQKAVCTITRSITLGIPTHVCCTVSGLNHGELESFAASMASLGVKRINFSRYVPTGRATSDELDLTPGEWHAAIILCNRIRTRFRGQMDVVTHLAQQILVDEEVRAMPAFIGCQAGIGQGCISSQGFVWPCVLLPLQLGNVRIEPFREIWSKSEQRRMLHYRENLKGRCGECSQRSQCGGCRAVAFARTGDFLSEDPRCWLGQPSSGGCRTSTEERSVL